MPQKLPIAIVIPHAGLDIPPELMGRIALTEAQIFNEADVYTDLIYDFHDRVEQCHIFPVARSIIDVNRPNTAHPKLRPGDGIVKRMTSYGADVYREGQEPDAALEQALIDTYWRPWHATMAAIAADDSIKLVLDCHSMAALGPARFENAAQIRPRVSASNLGDTEGNPVAADAHISAPPELTRHIGQQFGDALATIPDLAPTSAPFAINTPYSGGPNIWMHGGKAQPWLMIELSRATYIGEQTGDSPVKPPDMTRIEQIRDNLWQAIAAII
ncbi:MAG: N-formylglutamate amidohydrolase [Aggregatilineales bacterium]